MTQSLWGPDGQWIGSPQAPPAAPPAAPPQPEQDVERVARFAGVGCLSAVGLALLLPALFFGMFALVSGASEETADATATVLSVEPGGDAFGMQPYCFTVEYVVGGRPYTGRTCSITVDTRSVPGGDDETFEEAERRFAEQHPPGSQVEVSYEVDDPGRIAGGVMEVGSDWTSANPVMTAVMTGLALLFVAGSFAAFYGAVRLVRRRRAATPVPPAHR